MHPKFKRLKVKVKSKNSLLLLNLAKLRHKFGLTQIEVAVKVGCRPQTISKLENQLQRTSLINAKIIDSLFKN